MLGRRSHAAAALRAKLLERHPEADVEAAIERLVALRLLDDRAYAESFVCDRFERRGLGRHRIRDALCAVGLSEEIADEAISTVIDAASERERAAAALARYRSRRRAAGGDQAAGAFRYLVGRGFPADLVRDLLGVSL